MIRISSRAARFQKTVFPLIWFGFLAIFLMVAVVAVLTEDPSGPWPMFLIMPIVMAAAGYVMMKKAIWPLMDEVYDADDHLVVIRNGEEARIPLSEIVNISAPAGKTTYVTLRLRHAGRFGNEIAFMPESSFSFNPFGKNPIVEELITRVDRARLTARNV
jgi:hypothetical protein